jgi:cytochrome P450
VQTFFRTTTRAVEIAGTTLPEGEKVLLFLAAANRDPRRWSDPDRFDIRRKAAGHVGFGYGIHQCVGQMVARLEAEVFLSALLGRVAEFELDGAPAFRLNNTLRGLESLPLRIRADTARP